MKQSHCKRWSEIADCFIFFTHFSVKLEMPVCSTDKNLLKDERLLWNLLLKAKTLLFKGW